MCRVSAHQGTEHLLFPRIRGGFEVGSGWRTSVTFQHSLMLAAGLSDKTTVNLNAGRPQEPTLSHIIVYLFNCPDTQTLYTDECFNLKQKPDELCFDVEIL